MKPARPLPATPPFVTLLTTAFRRPQALARNLASVCRQTAVDDLEQIVLPDHVGYGWEAMYGRVVWYRDWPRGRYVNWLNDDDALAGPKVVETARAQAADYPILIARVRKGEQIYPQCDPLGSPVMGAVDLGSYIVRLDVWQRHVTDYGHRYEGDYDHAVALHRAGYPVRVLPFVWAEGPASGGRPEVDW